MPLKRKGKKRKDYAFWRQFNEKPSIIPGCRGSCRVKKEDSVGAGPQNMFVNLFLMAQYAGQSKIHHLLHALVTSPSSSRMIDLLAWIGESYCRCSLGLLFNCMRGSGVML